MRRQTHKGNKKEYKFILITAFKLVLRSATEDDLETTTDATRCEESCWGADPTHLQSKDFLGPEWLRTRQGLSHHKDSLSYGTSEKLRQTEKLKR